MEKAKKARYIMQALIKSKQLIPMIVSMSMIAVINVLSIRSLMLLASVVNTKDSALIKEYLILQMILIVLNATYTYIGRLVSKIVFTTLNNDVAYKITKSEFQMYSKYGPGEMYSILESLGNISGIIDSCYIVFKNITKIIITIASLKFISSIIVIPVTVIYAIGAISLIFLFRKWKEISDKRYEIRKHRNKLFDDCINGFKEMHSNNTNERHYLDIFKDNSKIMDLFRYNRILHVVLELIIDIVSYGGDIIIILVLLGGDGIKVTSIYTAIMITGNLIDPLINITDNSAEWSEQIVSLDKVMKFMEYENHIQDGTINLKSFDESISIEDMSFKYDDSTLVLNKINLNIPKGSHVGICGVSGGGKSTLLKLIPRFYDVTEGAIKIDGIDIRELQRKSLLDKIGMVHQDTFIFDDTIRNNILYPVLDKNVTENELIEACKKACIYDFIMSLDEKFETKVGARGMKLSGGQKQRIALARIFLSNKDIILLDEATSALDNNTEDLVQEALEMCKDKTMIIVAHRLSTIQGCDKIVVISNHQIAEEGTHVELVEMNGKYASMIA